MRRWSSVVLFVTLGLLGSAVAWAQQDARAARVAGDRPECVAVRAQPVFNGSGYNHLVTITNSCPAAVVCQVTTTVNPQAIRVSVARGASETVNTFLNAAGYGFAATVHCQSAAR